MVAFYIVYVFHFSSVLFRALGVAKVVVFPDVRNNVVDVSGTSNPSDYYVNLVIIMSFQFRL